MKGYFVGIDVGTSSVKILAKEACGASVKSKAGYAENTPYGWINAIISALKELWNKISPQEVCAIGLSSQVGTYITDDGLIIPWNSSAGKEELERIKSDITEEEFLKNISMRHPDIISFPLPRLSYIKRVRPDCKAVDMPKEIVVKAFAGKRATDVFSQRGIYDFVSGNYALCLTKKLGLDFSFAEVLYPTDIAGYITQSASETFGFTEGTPVIVGCNDFFAGLLGIGVCSDGDSFDLSGTSEHIGYISDGLSENAFTSGNYFNGFANYGGTKASGKALGFAIENFGINDLSLDLLNNSPPVFLPYLCGERAPLFDENARGVFFGINGGTTKRDMAYSVFEGVVFGLYDIFDRLGDSSGGRIKTGGGSSVNVFLNKLKAEIFGKEILVAKETDSSALGAAMLAMLGAGEYSDINTCIQNEVGYAETFSPTGKYAEKFKKRFAIFRSLYKDLKEDFNNFD